LKQIREAAGFAACRDRAGRLALAAGLGLQEWGPGWTPR